MKKNYEHPKADTIVYVLQAPLAAEVFLSNGENEFDFGNFDD